MCSTEEKKRKYYSGLCDAMAIALYKKYNYPLGLVVGWYKDNEELCFEPAHAVIIIDETTIADVDGKDDIENIKKRVVFVNDVFKITVEKSSIEEIRYAFSIVGVSEQDIKEAEEFLVETGYKNLKEA